jgi:diamine N-acetyltransferase
MSSRISRDNPSSVTLHPVTEENWREVARLRVTEAQREFVAEPTYYLCLCCYGDLWNPLAVYLGEEVVGFMMWAIDPADGSCWLGGILIDEGRQGRGYGRAAVRAALAKLARENGCRDFALSYHPTNAVARHLYASLGFEETGEREGDEVVARLSLNEEV